jgi:hypothetical protein
MQQSAIYDRLVSGQPVTRIVFTNGNELRNATGMTVAWVDENVNPEIWLSLTDEGVKLTSNADPIVDGYRVNALQGFVDWLGLIESVG